MASSRRGARRSSTSGATRSSGSTTSVGCSCTSHVGTPTCTAASSASRTTTAPISASSSSTTRATRRRADTGRSRSSPGRSTRASSPAIEGETHVVVDVPSGRLDAWARVRDGRVASVRFRNVPAFVWAEGVELGGHTVDVAFGGAFYASLEEHGRTGGAAAADRARTPDQARGRGVAGRRAPRRARAARRLRRRLLAAGGREPADAAERHGVRGRRGRPLALREWHVGAPCAPRPQRAAAAGRGARSTAASSAPSSARASSATPRSRACRRSSRRSRGAHTAPGSTSSRSTPPIRCPKGFLLR